jgi:LacI family transcriptional regulator
LPVANSYRIGLVVDPVGSYGRGVIRGVMTFAKSNPAWTITVEPRWSFDEPQKVDDWEVDGLIVQVPTPLFEEQILHRGVPATNVSNYLPAVRLPTVVPDDAAVARTAADYLVRRGFKHFGYFGPDDLGFSQIRQPTFAAAIAEAGAECHVCNPHTTDMVEWLRALPKPAGVLGCNDDWAHRLLNACRRAGVAVPDDVAVLGVDDDELLNALVTPSLSSIVLPTERIGYEAAAWLDRLLPGGAPADLGMVKTLPPLAVVTRRSTDILAITDTEVAAAVKFIRDHGGDPTVGVRAVLEEVALSRRSLERRFRDALGRTIAEEVRRVRVEAAMQLLVSTDLPMPEVAAASGFTTATRFGIVFHKMAKLTPTEYRRIFRVAGDRHAASAFTPPGSRKRRGYAVRARRKTETA